MGCNQLLGVNECVDIDQAKSVNISTQPHPTSCIKFLDRENNNKNITLPLGKQIYFTTVWGCAEILPKAFVPLINQLSCIRGDHCVGSSLTPPHWTANFISSHLWWLALISCLLASLWINWGIACFSYFTNISQLLSPVKRLPSWTLCLCRGRVFFTLFGYNIFSFLVVLRRVFFMSLLVFDFDVPSWFLLVRWQSCDCFSSRRACLSSFWGEIRGSTHPGNPWKQTDHMFESSVSPASAFTSTIVNSPPRSRHGTLILAGKWCHSTSWLRN